MALIRSTQTKLKIANWLYRFVKLIYRDNIQVITRKGITIEADLREGLDLSMFIFGDFQSHIYKSPYLNVPSDAVIFDVGGNIGILSLFFAQKVPKGQVHAFEPTHFALKKFKRNVGLNPSLLDRITLNHCFVSSKSETAPAITAFSSWRVDGLSAAEGPIHEVHKGEAMDTSGVPSVTIDEYCERNQIEKLSLIKIDTDGHEIDVLRGARKSIMKFKPFIVFELCGYLMEERNLTIDDYTDFFESVQYKMYDETKKNEITKNNHKRILPQDGGIDAMAFPVE
jgi:FkbM family methyltransferase